MCRSETKILLNGVLVGAAFCVLPATKPLALALIAVATGLMIYINGYPRPHGHRSSWKRSDLNWPSWLMFTLCLIYIARQFQQDLALYSQIGRTYDAVDYGLKNLALLLGVFVLSAASGEARIEPRLTALVIGIGIYAGFNLTISALDLPIGDPTNVFDESRFAFADYRWLPPYTRSNGTFAMTCTVATLTGGVILLHSFKNPFAVEGTAVRSSLAIAVLLAGTASVACQFRGHLLTVMSAILWVILRGRMRIAILLAVIGWFVNAPIILRGESGVLVTYDLGIDYWLEKIGSNLSDIFTLSGRTSIYDYGWERLSIPRIALWGEGPSLRDSGITTVLQGTSIRGVSYHSGLLDLLLTHGIVFAAVFIACIAVALKRLTTRLEDRHVKHDSSTAIAYFVFWLSLSGMDGGFASSFEVFVLMAIPIASYSNCWIPRGQYLDARPVRTVAH